VEKRASILKPGGEKTPLTRCKNADPGGKSFSALTVSCFISRQKIEPTTQVRNEKMRRRDRAK